jgi:hypothetical protein
MEQPHFQRERPTSNMGTWVGVYGGYVTEASLRAESVAISSHAVLPHQTIPRSQIPDLVRDSRSS